VSEGGIKCAHGHPGVEVAVPDRGPEWFQVEAPGCRLCDADTAFAKLPYRKPERKPIELTEPLFGPDDLPLDGETLPVVDLDEAAEPTPAMRSLFADRGPATALPRAAKDRKERPICRGVLDYFPDAIAEVAHVSYVGNEQHNPGQPMHWAKEKSTDEADALVRHLLERGKLDTDGLRHTAKVAWRALALLQREIDAERAQ
jgi:hypothetical protein